jgi:hypothetical protein
MIKIKKEFPNAYELYIKWYANADVEQAGYIQKLIDNCVFTDIRSCYDFFDEQGIIIEIMIVEGGKNPYKNWFFHITKTLDFWGNNNYKTRQQAEEKAFIKAFEFLEGRIKNDKEKS